jgi:hypothetical protein
MTHDELVEEVCRKVYAECDDDWDDDKWTLEPSRQLYRKAVTAALSLIHSRLSEVTSEMVEAAQTALQKYINGIPSSERRGVSENGRYVLVSNADKHTIRFRAMLGKSPLASGD